jgi:hypothetical protein
MERWAAHVERVEITSIISNKKICTYNQQGSPPYLVGDEQLLSINSVTIRYEWRSPWKDSLKMQNGT